MSKVAIITDSNSGIMQNEAKDNLFVVPMPCLIDGEEYYEDVNLTQNEFYQKLQNECKISTSQPSYSEVTDIWNKALETYDKVIYIPMSSSLSAGCHACIQYAKNEYEGKVLVVDNQRISVTQKASVHEALEMAKQGKTAEEIYDYLMQTKGDSSIYIMVPTLKYLKRGGRITPAAAAIGTLLNIKPILQIHGGKLDSFAKVMNLNQAKQRLITAVKKDIETKLNNVNSNLVLAIAHSNNPEAAEKFKLDVEKEFPNLKIKYVDQLPLSISCHIGPGSLALVATRLDLLNY